MHFIRRADEDESITDSTSSHWYTQFVRAKMPHYTQFTTEDMARAHVCKQERKKEKKSTQEKSSSFFWLHLVKQFEWNAVNFLLLQCSFLMLTIRLYIARNTQPHLFHFLQLEIEAKMLQVYYCHNETIYEQMLKFHWRHDHRHTKQMENEFGLKKKKK